ncbi:hypothetical protein KXQ82_10855 [Mucilaginibacter sp. HMF5004]|uniref:hypothetical protein n=1 Tax=Mucilaginibacter rivuli TaxID=2857527 RepID=UPI001C603885|nr:hypothetical protein [Mucilaginibacter rivuli]MBW4890220.1 hypothetical protein [Mucilaginibacter rivuli]
MENLDKILSISASIFSIIAIFYSSTTISKLKKINNSINNTSIGGDRTINQKIKGDGNFQVGKQND